MYDKTIGVDMDGVIAYSFGSFIKEIKKRYHIDMNPLDAKEFSIENSYPQVTKEMVKEVFTDPVTFERAFPIIRSDSCLRYLKDMGWSIFVITDRPMNCWEVTRKWLEKFEIPFDGLYLAKAAEKPKLCEELGIMYFVEDRRETTLELSRVCPSIFLLDRTYNQGVLPINVTRIKDWSDIVSDLCFPKVVGNG